jgi:hypothetical protein
MAVRCNEGETSPAGSHAAATAGREKKVGHSVQGQSRVNRIRSIVHFCIFACCVLSNSTATPMASPHTHRNISAAASPPSLTVQPSLPGRSVSSLSSSFSDTGTFEVHNVAPTPVPVAGSASPPVLTGGPKLVDRAPSSASFTVQHASASPVAPSPSSTSPTRPTPHAFLFDRQVSIGSNSGDMAGIDPSLLTSTAKFTPSTSPSAGVTPTSPRAQHALWQAKPPPPPTRSEGQQSEMQYQQQQLLRNSTSLTRTVIADQRRSQSQTHSRTQTPADLQQRLMRASVSEASLPTNTSAVWAQTVPRPLTLAVPASPGGDNLSALPSAALKAKAAKIASLISDFDAKFLEPAGSGPASGTEARMVYPQWALPFVEEMAGKMEAVLKAQAEAEAKEERERQTELKLKQIAALQSSPRSSPRAGSRRQSFAQSPMSSSRRGSLMNSPAASPAQPTHSRRPSFAVAQSPAASPLPVARSVAESPAQLAQPPALNVAHSAEFAPVHERSPDRPRAQPGARGMTGRSQSYLTSLFGRDVGASTLNVVFRATERSPSPPRRRRTSPSHSHQRPEDLTKVQPGPTIPKASRFSPVRPLSPPHGSGRKRSPSKRSKEDRERDLELEALKIQVRELVGEMRAQRLRDQEMDEMDGFGVGVGIGPVAAADEEIPEDIQIPSASFGVQTSPWSSPRAMSRRTSFASMPPQQVVHHHQGVDEGVLAQALIRIGESNRERFLALVEQIALLQRQMAEQQERFAGSSNASQHMDPAEKDRMAQELARLQAELASSSTEKHLLAAQIKELRSHAEKSKFALMEKMALLNGSASDASRGNVQDKALLRTYEEDLRSSRDAIAQLQNLVQREADHARAFRADRDALQSRLDTMAQQLKARVQADREAAYAAGRKSLTPAARLKSLMHKYMASFYRTQFQNLLEAQKHGNEATQRVEAELVITKEHHARELVQQQRTHQAILKHIQVTHESKEEMHEELVTKLDQATVRLDMAEAERARKEQDLMATELLAKNLQHQLTEQSLAGIAPGDVAFNEFLVASFRGDYLRMRNDAKMLKVIYDMGDDEVKFSDYVQRIDQSVQTQTCCAY